MGDHYFEGLGRENIGNIGKYCVH